MLETRKVVLAITALILAAGAADAQVKAPAAKKPQDTRLKPVPGQTWVRTGHFNEIDQTQRTSATINEPGILRFLWGTKLESDEGFWRLRRRTALSWYSLVATGVATPGKGGRFDVDLRPYVPDKPPIEPALYHLEVVARKRSVTGKTTTSAGQAGAKVSVQELGAWSAPVVITYAVNPAPPTSFDIGDVYRKATLVLDRIVLVADQDGPGQEEYAVAGFIQELQRECPEGGQDCPFSDPLAQRRFGPISRNLNPPGEGPFGWTFDASQKPPLQKAKNAFEFPLGTGTNRVAGPRRFAVAISLIEKDAGASVDDWNAAVGDLSSLAEAGEILDLDEDEVNQFLSDHAADAIRFVADGVQVLAAIADIGSAAPVVGTGVAFAAFVIVPIIADMADDYYGTRAAHLTLASNRVSEVHKVPGALVGTGAQRRYVSKRQTLQYKGPSASNAAAAFDGIVDIEFHWEFSQMEQE